MRTNRIPTHMALLALSGAIANFAGPAPASAQGTVLQRPIQDFVVAQGTLPAPPGFTANFIGWIGRTGPKEDLTTIMTFDYAGLDAASVGLPAPRIRGTVIERPLANGGTNVKISLQTSKELAYVHACAAPIPGNPCPAGAVLFGLTPAEAAADPPAAAYGSSNFQVEYNVARPPGAPMEDLIALFFGGLPYDSLPLMVAFAGSANGPLRAASGCPEGTAGRASATQTGLILAGIRNGFRGALVDAFPAEWVDIRPECN